MRCPQCQHELIKTKVGSFCLNCGYAGVGLPEKPVAKPKPALSKSVPVPQAAPKPPDLKLDVHDQDAVIDAQPQASEVHAKVGNPAPPVMPTPIPIAPESNDKIYKAPMAPSIHLAETEPLPPKPLPAQVFHPLKPIKAADEPTASASAEPHPVKLPEPVKAGPAQTKDAAASPPPPPAKPVAHRPEHPHHISTIHLLIVGAIILGIGLAAYILPARAAAKSFSEKLASAQSFRFTGTLKLHGTTFLSVLNSDLIFGGAYHNGGTNNIRYTGIFASRNYDGQFIASGGKLYTQMSGNDLPFIRYNQGLNTYHILASNWYRSNIDTSLYKYYCETRPDTKYPSPLVWYQALRQVKLQPSPIIAYGQSVDGHTVTHVRGSIDGHDLNSAWANINSSLPDDCQWNNLIEDVSGLDVKFDLWTSPSYDQIQLHLKDKDLGITGTVVIKLDQYNSAASASLPASTLDLSTIFAGRELVQNRDYQRRADIDNLKRAIDAYAAANKSTPPSSLSKLVPKYLAKVPEDPNGNNYAYTITKKTYTLSATLEDSGQLYTVTGPN